MITFNREHKKRLYSLQKTDFSHEVMIKTKFGTMYISSDYAPTIKLASIHSKLVGDIKEFKEVTGYDINLFNGKLNSYSTDVLYLLDELDEFIDNLVFLSV